MSPPAGRNCGKTALQPTRTANAAAFLAKNALFLAAIAHRAPCLTLFPQLRRVRGGREGDDILFQLFGYLCVVRLLKEKDKMVVFFVAFSLVLPSNK